MVAFCGNIASGSAVISCNAVVSSGSSCVFAGIGIINASSSISCNAQNGHSWTIETESTNTWTTESSSSNVWTTETNTENEWEDVAFTGNTWTSQSQGNNVWQLNA